MSDHRIITVSRRISMKNQHGNLVFKNRDKVGNLNFMSKKVDWTPLRRELGNVDWKNIAHGKNGQEIHSTIYETIYKVSTKNVPARKQNKTKLVPSHRKILMRRRSKLNKKLQTTISQRAGDKLMRKPVK